MINFLTFKFSPTITNICPKSEEYTRCQVRVYTGFSNYLCIFMGVTMTFFKILNCLIRSILKFQKYVNG